jgi:hypothetical protein
MFWNVLYFVNVSYGKILEITGWMKCDLVCCVQCYYLIFFCFDIVSCLTAFCPVFAPINLAKNERHNPMNIIIPKGEVQNVSSDVAASGTIILQRSGTYQTLFGCVLQIIKQ